jgi:anti-sigma-K factor RskA
MTEHELLLQRFLDNELSADERLRFLDVVARDDAFRRDVRDSGRLLRACADLPRVAASPGLIAAMRRRLQPSTSGRWEALRERWFTLPSVNWAFAPAIVAICVLMIGAWQLGRLSVPAPHGGDVTAAAPEQVVRLVMMDADARTVSVAGDFNGWHPEATPLHRTEKGLWAVTLPLKPGRYHYMFVVDGRDWITDPFAGDMSVDGFGAENAVLEIL